MRSTQQSRWRRRDTLAASKVQGNVHALVSSSPDDEVRKHARRMASHSALQILASFLGGTIAAATFFKATATEKPGAVKGVTDDPVSNDQLFASQSENNSQYVKQEEIDQIQHGTIAMKGNKESSKTSPSLELNLALMSSLTVVLGLSLVYFGNKPRPAEDDDHRNSHYREGYTRSKTASDSIKDKDRPVSHKSAAINRLEKDIEVWRKRYKEKMKENLRLKKKVVQVQRNAKSFFGHNEEDKEALMQENTALRETNLKLERHIVQLQSGAEKLRAAYSKAGPRSSLFGKTRDVIQAEQRMKSVINKVQATPHKRKGADEKRSYPPSPSTHLREALHKKVIYRDALKQTSACLKVGTKKVATKFAST